MTVHVRNASPETNRRLDLFALRCRDLRDRVLTGNLAFIDAIDMAYSAAIWSGLSDDIGDDVVQQVMAIAFGTVPSEQRAGKMMNDTFDALCDAAEEKRKRHAANGSAGPRSWRDHVITAAQLQRQTFPPVSYVVPQLIPEGLSIIAGRPKVGKSWLALDVCIAVAAGRFCLGERKPRRAMFCIAPWKTTRADYSGASTSCCRRSARHGRNG